MTTQKKGEIIDQIMTALKNQAISLDKKFNGPDVFFGLLFKSDQELIKIKNLCKI
jgi:hypothetical protein